ncbi:type II toxin-antitoxin system RelE/ParE family toxin [Streptomyces sp. NPDC003023]|uniref:type II toxin-antitoxin system RelE/ParE family toxin n=1 Tax=Streptomyces sp. NPDC003023 TaxID=3364675 RepID=UPI00367CAE51
MCSIFWRTAGAGAGSLVDRISGSSISNLKELRTGSSGGSEVRVLFVFDPLRNAVILVGGDKAGNWSGWYRTAIKEAEVAYKAYRDERE